MAMFDAEDNQSFPSIVIEKSEITSQRPKPNHFGRSYSDPLTLSFLIIKDESVCETQGDYRLTPSEINSIRSWLESPHKPTELVVDASCTYEYLQDSSGNYLVDNGGNSIMARISDVFKPDGESVVFSSLVHYYGLFTNIQPFIHRGDCYGLYLTFTCNAPYGYSDEFEYNFSVPSSGVVKNYSAEKYEYLKPTITILSSGGGTVTIKNSSDQNRQMTLNVPSGKTKLIVDCERKIITDGNGNLVSLSDVGIDTPIEDNYSFLSNDTYLIYWLSLVAGTNNLVFSGTSINQIKISGRYIIKSGGF